MRRHPDQFSFASLRLLLRHLGHSTIDCRIISGRFGGDEELLLLLFLDDLALRFDHRLEAGRSTGVAGKLMVSGKKRRGDVAAAGTELDVLRFEFLVLPGAGNPDGVGGVAVVLNGEEEFRFPAAEGFHVGLLPDPAGGVAIVADLAAELLANPVVGLGKQDDRHVEGAKGPGAAGTGTDRAEVEDLPVLLDEAFRERSEFPGPEILGQRRGGLRPVGTPQLGSGDPVVGAEKESPVDIGERLDRGISRARENVLQQDSARSSAIGFPEFVSDDTAVGNEIEDAVHIGELSPPVGETGVRPRQDVLHQDRTRGTSIRPPKLVAMGDSVGDEKERAVDVRQVFRK